MKLCGNLLNQKKKKIRFNFAKHVYPFIYSTRLNLASLQCQQEQERICLQMPDVIRGKTTWKHKSGIYQTSQSNNWLEYGDKPDYVLFGVLSVRFRIKHAHSFIVGTKTLKLKDHKSSKCHIHVAKIVQGNSTPDDGSSVWSGPCPLKPNAIWSKRCIADELVPQTASVLSPNPNKSNCYDAMKMTYTILDRWSLVMADQCLLSKWKHMFPG